MSIEKYLEEMRSIQSKFLEFLEDDENAKEKFRSLNLILEDIKIRDNKNDLRLFLHHIASVCANNHRGKNFFSKIECVLQIFKEELKKYYTNSEIFNIFKGDKRILLFLIKEKIIIFDEHVAKSIIKSKYLAKKYPQYFAPEMKLFMDKDWFPKYDPDNVYYKNEWVEEIKKELPDNFYELRKIGENESYISKLIREDSIQDFIIHVNQNCISLNALIVPSIFETNSFLIKKQNESDSKNGISLIEYAAFFGSIQIIKYLQIQGEELTPSLWLYAIHSQNAELIHFLESNNVEPTVTYNINNQIFEENSWIGCIRESIKCNHNAIANYFIDNYLENVDQTQNETFIQIFKYYNFGFIQSEHISELSFYLLCKYDYFLFVDELLSNNEDININDKIIQSHIF